MRRRTVSSNVTWPGARLFPLYKLLYLARRATTISREHWPGTWRSHAKFAARFPGLPQGIRYSRYCNRVDALPPAAPAPGENTDAIALSLDYDGIAVASSDSLELLKGGAFTAEQFESILEDERRVFDRPTSESSFYCVERPLRDGPLGEALLMLFLARQPALSRLAFKEWLLAQVESAARKSRSSVGGMTRCTCNLPLHVPPRSLPFDAILECWYTDLDAALRSEPDARLLSVFQDHGRFCDAQRSIALLAEVCSRWPLP